MLPLSWISFPGKQVCDYLKNLKNSHIKKSMGMSATRAHTPFTQLFLTFSVASFMTILLARSSAGLEPI